MGIVDAGADNLLEIEHEPDGRWTVRVRLLPDVEAEGDTQEEALELAVEAAFRAVASLMQDRRKARVGGEAGRRLDEALAYVLRVLGEVEDRIDRHAANATRDEPSIPWSAVRDEL